MAEFIVNEINHVVDMDEHMELFLKKGLNLPDGLVISDCIEKRDLWQIYLTKDGKFNVLCAKDAIASRWIDEGFLDKDVFFKYKNAKHDDLNLMFVPTSSVLTLANSVRFYGSTRYACSFAGALWHTRSINHKINLRDGIFCEYYGVILPSYSKAREVADRALFLNCFSKNNDEDISSSSEMENPGLSFKVFKDSLKDNGYRVFLQDPLLQVGEYVDDYVNAKAGTIITSALEVNDKYEIYSTNKDIYILLLTNEYANTLIDKDLISQINLSSIQVGIKRVYAKALSKKFALEPLNYRHFGISVSDAFALCQTLGRTHREYPYARLSDALYSQELSLLLPVDFATENESIYKIAQDIINDGPFALSPFDKDTIDDLLAIAVR